MDISRGQKTQYKDIGYLLQFLSRFISDAVSEYGERMFKTADSFENYREEDIDLEIVGINCPDEEDILLLNISKAEKLLRQVKCLIESEIENNYHVPGINYTCVSNLPYNRMSNHYYRILKKLWKRALKIREDAQLNMDTVSETEGSTEEEVDDESEYEHEDIDNDYNSKDDEESYKPE